MPTRVEPEQIDRVKLLIGGQMHDRWQSYEIDSDLLVPADAWQVSLGVDLNQKPPAVAAGAVVEVRVGDDVVMTGRVDEVNHQVSKNENTFSLAGRDKAADLLDCSAPLFGVKQVSLEQIAAKIVSDFGIKTPRIDADATLIREKVNIQPGDTAWNALVHAAEANGLWPWFEPDGTLVIGGPDYSVPVSATLVINRYGKGNNVLSLKRTESMHGRYSKVTVYGQTHGTEQEQGKNALRSSAEDVEVTWHRPKIVTDDCDSVAECRNRAQKIIDESHLNGLTLTIQVQGHRIVAPGQPADGMLWKPGQRIRVDSEPHGIDGIYFLMARKFTRSRADGTRTMLTLKKDRAWIVKKSGRAT